MVFIGSVIINEVNVWGYPVSEQFDAVGQVRYPRIQQEHLQ